MVLNELLQNAVDHAFPNQSSSDGGYIGAIDVVIGVPEPGWLELMVRDDGVGVGADFDVDGAHGLGTSIIGALATSDLGGTFTLRNRTDGPGAEAVVRVPVRQPSRDELLLEE